MTDSQDAFTMEFADKSRSMWDAFRLLSREPRPHIDDVRLSLLLAHELAIRDALSRYIYYYDSKDVSGAVSMYAADAVLVNPRGTYVGHDAIRANYQYLVSLTKMVMHYAMNHLVRLEADLTTAWMTAYIHSVGLTSEGQYTCTVGTYLDHLRLVDGDWLIIERRITANFRHGLVNPPRVTSPPPPPPTRIETSIDLVGRDYFF
jgi:ketosteroid isomerase-like protein